MALSEGMSVMDALGSGAPEVVAPQKSSFTDSISNAFSSLFMPKSMETGQSVMDATGGQGEVHARKGSPFATAVLGAFVIGGLFKLVESFSTPPMTDQQKLAAYAQEEQRKANIAKEDARRQTAYLEDEKRKAFFAKKPGM